MSWIRLLAGCIALVSAAGAARADEPARIIYMDDCSGGCSIQPGYDSAMDNRSSLIDEPVTLSAWRYSPDAWELLVECVAEVYAPFDVVVTDQRPPPGQPHQRAIVAGVGAELGSDYVDSLGVSPTWCEVHDDVITFTFANAFKDPTMMCATVAQETGHAYGLEHTFACNDAMSWQLPCGAKLFRDADNPCGDEVAFDECICGGASLNSYRSLLSLLGANPNPFAVRPDVFLWPETGSFGEDEPIADGPFWVGVYADDAYGIERVELYINGEMYAVVPHSSFDEYRLEVGDDVSDGVLELEAVAHNGIGVSSSSTATVIKRAACQSSADCLDGAACDEGRCAQPVRFLPVGEPCSAADDCATGRCEATDTGSVCSEKCYDTPGGDTCPDGWWCHSGATASAACWPGERPPEPEPESSGCRASGGSGPATAALVALALLVVVRRRARLGS